MKQDHPQHKERASDRRFTQVIVEPVSHRILSSARESVEFFREWSSREPVSRDELRDLVRLQQAAW